MSSSKCAAPPPMSKIYNSSYRNNKPAEVSCGLVSVAMVFVPFGRVHILRESCIFEHGTTRELLRSIPKVSRAQAISHSEVPKNGFSSLVSQRVKCISSCLALDMITNQKLQRWLCVVKDMVYPRCANSHTICHANRHSEVSSVPLRPARPSFRNAAEFSDLSVVARQGGCVQLM